ncbi:hypothetical protein LTR35_011164 [Friedmanniomyces endolithicus]|uniref:Uncharacterized protein n=1 Tax=Friedmanniomyces endolithicus TaxID=329885 RepID=A0AAN6J5G9_9PEZI|nr:hypothetical protein LTR35_011164 [Friedmanniomyces endolithicus]KAK0287142.1 hypothetical protein LTS00_010180 [Friedmanniomyces endolithicus]KAK0317600.1 hypothetical protein LTR82_011369 [Friedmanniomyces endolithicus]KAK0994181.1 hypothetical protein LTR54_010856 [Friedmanniomyces endolithicus]
MINSGSSTSTSASSTGPRLSHPVGRKNARSIREHYFRSQSGCFVAPLKEQQTEDDEKRSTNRLPPLKPVVDARPRELAICQPNERLPCVKEVLQVSSGDRAASRTSVQSQTLGEISCAAPENVPAHQSVSQPPPFRADDLPQHPTGHLLPFRDVPAIATSMLGGRAMLTAEQEGWGGEQWAPSSPVVSSALQPQQLQRSQQQELLQTAMKKNFEGEATRRELERQKQVWAKESRRWEQQRRQVRIQKHSSTQKASASPSCGASKLSALPSGSQDLTGGGRPKVSSVVSVAH